MEIGRKVYYEKITGNTIISTSEMKGNVIKSTIDQDFEMLLPLQNYVRESVGVMELEYGEFSQDFRECNGVRVNLDTLELEFSYPDPSQEEPQEPVYIKPLTEQVEELKSQNTDLMIALAEMAEAQETENTQTQLALAELAEIAVGGVV